MRITDPAIEGLAAINAAIEREQERLNAETDPQQRFTTATYVNGMKAARSALIDNLSARTP